MPESFCSKLWLYGKITEQHAKDIDAIFEREIEKAREDQMQKDVEIAEKNKEFLSALAIHNQYRKPE